MPREFLESFLPPINFAAGGVLIFNVFVVSSSDDNDLRAQIDAALREIALEPGLKDRALLRPYHYEEQAALPANAHGQSAIDHQIPPAQRHIVVGLLGRRLGVISREEELLPALQATGPRPAVFLFAADQVLEESREASALTAALARLQEIETFVDQVVGIATSRGDKPTIERFGAGPDGLSKLRALLKKQLFMYTQMWVGAVGGRPREPAAAGSSLPATAASRAHDDVPRYLGLKPYGKKDARHFFGRRHEIDSLCQIAHRPDVQSLQLRGGSGTGKSSLVFAGLLPNLHNAAGAVWDSLWLKPGDDPFLALATAINNRRPSLDQVEPVALGALAEQLASRPEALAEELGRSMKKVPDGRRVLYVDQLEELLMLPEGKDFEPTLVRRKLFIERLTGFLRADPSNLLISSIRTDRDELLERPEWRDLHHLLNAGVQRRVVAPDLGEGLQEIVTGPARLAGFAVEPVLLDALRDDTRDIPSWTPLVSAVLEDMVHRWQDRTELAGRRELTLDLYEAGGGLWEIIARRVKAAMTSLTVAQRETTLLRLFPFLVKLDERSGLPSKKRFSVHAFPPGTEERLLLDQLIRSNLLLDEGEVELVHDILFEEWQELRDWIRNHQSTDLDEMAALERETDRWLLRNQDNDLLLSSERLARAEKVLAGNSSWAERSSGVRAYVQASRSLRERQDLIRSIKTSDLKELLLLRRNRDLRLTAADVAGLDEFAALYYAAFPDAIPAKARAAAATGLAGNFASGSGDAETPKAPDIEGVISAGSSTVRATMNAGPQHFAAFGGSIAVLERLQALGLDIFAKTSTDSTAIHWAAAGGHTAVVEWLLAQMKKELPESEALAHLNRATATGYQPLWNAVINGSPSLIEYLLRSIDDPTLGRAMRDEWSLVAAACSLGHLEALQVLLGDPRFDLSTAAAPHSRTPLMTAILQGHWQVARWLLDEHPGESGVDRVDESGWTALGLALERSSRHRPAAEAIGVIRLLLGLELALDRRMGNTDEIPLLVLAVRSGSPELVEFLLDRSDINARDAQGRTALHYAAIQADTGILHRLLAREDLERHPMDRQGVTPLVLAIGDEKEEAFRWLLDAGPLPRWNAANGRPLFGKSLDVTQAGDPPAVSSSGRERVRRQREKLRLGRMAEALLARGVKLPRWKVPARDKAGRLIGFTAAPWTEAPIEELRAELASTPADFRWPSPAVEGFAWTEHPPLDAARLLIEVVRASDSARGTLEALTLRRVRSAPMPHYPGVEMLEVAVEDWSDQPAVLVVLREADGSCVHLDGGSWNMHQLNRQRRLELAHESAAESYLRMFMACLTARAGGGTFRVIDHAGDLAPDAGSAAGETLAAAREKVRPLRFVTRVEANEQSPHARFTFEVNVLHSDSLYETEMSVYANGNVDMDSDTGIADALGIPVDVFEHGLKYSRVIPSEKQPSQDGDQVSG